MGKRKPAENQLKLPGFDGPVAGSKIVEDWVRKIVWQELDEMVRTFLAVMRKNKHSKIFGAVSVKDLKQKERVVKPVKGLAKTKGSKRDMPMAPRKPKVRIGQTWYAKDERRSRSVTVLGFCNGRAMLTNVATRRKTSIALHDLPKRYTLTKDPRSPRGSK